MEAADFFDDQEAVQRSSLALMRLAFPGDASNPKPQASPNVQHGATRFSAADELSPGACAARLQVHSFFNYLLAAEAGACMHAYVTHTPPHPPGPASYLAVGDAVTLAALQAVRLFLFFCYPLSRGATCYVLPHCEACKEHKIAQSLKLCRCWRHFQST